MPIAYQITHGYSSQKIGMWADLNNDGTFDDATEKISTAASVGNTTNGTLIIPGATVPGTYRLRVVDRFNNNPVACNVNGYGEAHDYKLVVTAAPSCLSPTAVTTSNASTTSFDMEWTPSSTIPTNGYEVYYTTSNTPADASTTPNLTGLNGTMVNITGLQPSTQYFVWVRSACSSSDKSLWFDGGSITTTTFCPTVTAPTDAANGQSLTPTISWDAVTDATSYTLTVGTTPGGSDVMAGVNVGNVNSYTFTTPLLNSTTYYYTVNAANATISSNNCTERSFMTVCSPFTIPYFEGFENGYTDNTEVVGCMSQETVSGNQVWRANNTFTDYNRTPKTGNWNAFLRFSDERWLFVPVQLTAGVTYKASVYARQDSNVTTDANMTIAYGINASAAAMLNNISATTPITNGDYQKVSGSFMPPATGTYYIGFKGYVGDAPYYMSIDDISIEVAGSCLEPSAVSITDHTFNTAGVSWIDPATVPTNGYEVYYSTSNTPPTATTTPNQQNITTTTANLTGLTPESNYFVWVRSNCGSEKSSWEGPASFYTGYCVPSASSTPYFMGSVTTTGGTTNLNYTNASFIGYDNQYATSVTAAAGSTINLVLSADDTTDTYSYNAWIDWNNDMAFDEATEKVYVTDPNVSYESVGNASFTIPAGLTPGNYRLRTGVSWAGEMSACGPESDGNYVDFTLVVTGTQGTSEISANDQVKVYPNPFVDVLHISHIREVISVSITDASGRLVKTIAKPSAELHLGDLKTGMYMVTLQYKDGSTKTVKAMKK